MDPLNRIRVGPRLALGFGVVIACMLVMLAVGLMARVSDDVHGNAEISQISESNSARMHGIDEAARGLGDIAYRLQSRMNRFRTG